MSHFPTGRDIMYTRQRQYPVTHSSTRVSRQYPFTHSSTHVSRQYPFTHSSTHVPRQYPFTHSSTHVSRQYPFTHSSTCVPRQYPFTPLVHMYPDSTHSPKAKTKRGKDVQLFICYYVAEKHSCYLYKLSCCNAKFRSLF